MTIPDPVWPAYAEAEAALARVEQDLAAAPEQTGLLFERACLLDRLGRPDDARQGYLDVIARDFRHEPALVALGTLLFSQNYTAAAKTALDRAIAVNPGNLAARVHLGDLLRRSEQPTAARAEYQVALQIDPDCRRAHQGLAHILDEIDPAQADHHRNRGFAGVGIITIPYRGEPPPVRVLRLVSAHGGNIPLAEVLDDRIFLVHTVVVEFATPDLALPVHDVVFNTVGDADRCAPALQRMPELLARTDAPVLNRPQRVAATARAASHRNLGDLPGVIAPKCVETPRARLIEGPPPGFSFPLLLRAPGFHTGQHFCRVPTGSDLHDALAQLPGDPLLAIEYVDTRSPDGRFRKYRVMLIGGELLPLHLAIASDWKVHHFTAGMADSADSRAEEAQFLDHMPTVLGPVALAALGAIQASLGLDYAGVDFALAADGRIVVFEANATMTIAPPQASPIWDYRRPAIARAVEATRALLRRCPAAPAPRQIV